MELTRPDEAGPHHRTFMQWPSNRRLYRDRAELAAVQECLVEIANIISEFEPVAMVMDESAATAQVRRFAGGVEIWDIPTDDLWARDSGPLFLRNADGSIVVRSLNFNGWGNKQDHRLDRAVAASVAARLGVPVLNNGLVGEPGGVEQAPDGVLLANRSSWINPNRNRQAESPEGADQITAMLLTALGGRKMIWCDGVAGLDITDDHIDATARFVSDRDIVIQLPERSDDPFAISAHRTYQVLAAATNLAGQSYRLHVVAEPSSPRVRSEGFLASYVNYYVCNGAVVMAEFGDREADAEAQAIVARLYPDREVVALNVDEIGWLGGGIHCATQQQPV